MSVLHGLSIYNNVKYLKCRNLAIYFTNAWSIFSPQLCFFFSHFFFTLGNVWRLCWYLRIMWSVYVYGMGVQGPLLIWTQTCVHARGVPSNPLSLPSNANQSAGCCPSANLLSTVWTSFCLVECGMQTTCCLAACESGTLLERWLFMTSYLPWKQTNGWVSILPALPLRALWWSTLNIKPALFGLMVK